MRKITLRLFVLSLLATTFSINAQHVKQTLPEPIDGYIRCATDAYIANQLIEYPNMMGSEAFEQLLNARTQAIANTDSQRGALLRIPVVVHVIHSGEAVGTGRNISDAQVESQIQVLNEDFRRLVGSRGFSADPDSADTQIEFYLARQDPDCNPTTGIDRRDMSAIRDAWPFLGDTESILKPMTIWDPAVYVNMWTVEFSDSGLLGYAQPPGGNPMTDGVVMGYEFFGSNDAPDVNLSGSFNLGRTTTHELGHYLGLFHTFQGGCSATNDGIADTPAISGPTGGCPATADDSCAGGGDDMFEAYMDYTNDACMSIFTNGQSTRMRDVINTTRAGLLSGGIPDTALADLAVDASIQIDGFDDSCGNQTPNIRIINFGTSTLTSATVAYAINGGTPTNYNWTGSLAQDAFDVFQLPAIESPVGAGTLDVSVSTPATDQRTCNNNNSGDFTVTSATSAETTQLYFGLTTDNFSNETTWSFVDSNGTVVQSGGPYNGGTDDNTLFEFTFPLVMNECYTFRINDTYGDGICCSEGNGSYDIRETDVSGTLLISGGDFGSSASSNILANTLGVNNYFANDNLYVYPNPTSNQLHIKLANSNDLPNSYEIFNVLGQSIIRDTIENIQDLSINTSSLSHGAYFMKVTKDNASITLPFIKE